MPILPGDSSHHAVSDPYWNHASVSPPQARVVAAMTDMVNDLARRGLAAAVEAMESRTALRVELGRLLGAPPHTLALVPNTSAGIQAVAQGMDWEQGDVVVLFRGEFPANVVPWLEAAKNRGLEVRWGDIEDLQDDGDVGRLEELASGARLVALSAVQFQTGHRVRLSELTAVTHAAGAALFVDGIQRAGIVPTDLVAAGVDFFAAGGHKWLTGVEGTGVLYVAEQWHRRLRWPSASWLSVEAPVDFLMGEGPLRMDKPVRAEPSALEGGVLNSLGYAALLAGVRTLNEIGVEGIYAHVQGLLDALEPGLVQRGFTSLRASAPERRSGILSVHPPSDVAPQALVHALQEQGVGCAFPAGHIRFSPHWPNRLTEAERILAAVDAALP